MVAKKVKRETKRDSLLTSSDLKKGLQAEIRRLRSIAKEIASNYVSKLESRAEDLTRLVEDLDGEVTEDMRRLVKPIRALSVKPNKGRRKDLRKLETLLDDLRMELEILREKQEKADRARAGVSAGSESRSARSAASSSRSRRSPRRRRPRVIEPEESSAFSGQDDSTTAQYPTPLSA